MDVKREKMGTPDDTFVTDAWYMYRKESVASFWEQAGLLSQGGGNALHEVLGLCCPKPAGIHLSVLHGSNFYREKCFSLASLTITGGPLQCARYRSEFETGRMVRKDGSTLPSFSVAMARPSSRRALRG